MKRISLFLIAAILFAGIARSVTIAWYIPHGRVEYGWMNNIDGIAILSAGASDIVSLDTIASGYESGTVNVIAHDRTVTDPQTEHFSHNLIEGTVSFTGVALEDGKYYFLAMKEKDTGNYVIANAKKYVASDSVSNQSNGFYVDTVGNDVVPDSAEYIDPGVFGGTWTAAMTPEPTTLAFLALGIVGFVLRRKTIA